MGRRVDPIKVHLVTLAIWGVAIAAVLFVVLFPKVILFLALTVLAGFFYAKLYGIVERKLEEMEPLFEEDEPTPLPKEKAREQAKKKAEREPELDLPERDSAITAAPDLEADD